MPARHSWTWMLLALPLLAACASHPTAASREALATPTGSRVPASVDPANGLPTTAQPLQVVSGDELQDTGRTHLDGALRDLSPAAH